MSIDLAGLLARGRAAHEEIMPDTVRVVRDGEAVLDRATGHLVPPAPVVLYTGPARVKPARAEGREVTAGERVVVLGRYEVALPWDVEPALPVRPGDRVVVDASPDARMVGRSLVVVQVQYAAHATAWRLGVEDQA